MKANYTPVFALGGFTHSITIYENWTAERGLFGEVSKFENSRADKIIKEVSSYLSYPQIEKIKICMKYKEHGSYDEHGIPIR